ncbi:MAG: tRNA (cytidine(34)-2'-O)-methyltransferase [Rubripirellula sp.]
MNKKQSPRDETQHRGDKKTAASQNSLSRDSGGLQPKGTDRSAGRSEHDSDPDPPAGSADEAEASATGKQDDTAGSDPHAAHVVLYQPEIPQNTGNIGRTCVAVGAKLWIVRPAAFRLDDTKLKRAGLDYWSHLDRGDAVNWQDLLDQLPNSRMFFLSRFAKRTVWDAEFRRGDVFVFGRESAGLPKSILDPDDPRALRLPMSPHVRSLNLATTAGILLYEHQRQTADPSGFGIVEPSLDD